MRAESDGNTTRVGASTASQPWAQVCTRRLVQPGRKKFSFDLRPIWGRIVQPYELSQTAHSGAAYAWSQATCCATLGG